MAGEARRMRKAIFVSRLFDYLVREDVIEENQINFKARKEEGRARSIPIDVIKRLLKAPDQKTYAGLRDYVLMLFMLDTGIRPGEALQLMKSDFDFRSLEVTIRSEVSKTRRKRTLPISPEVSNIIQKLLAIRPSGWFNSPVFCSYNGKKNGEKFLRPSAE